MLSDLHADQNSRWRSAFAADKRAVKCGRGCPLDVILVVAGDICPMVECDVFHEVCSHLTQIYSNVIMVPGNHEFYNCSREKAVLNFKSICSSFGIHALLRDSVRLKNHLFLGTTLWTNPVDSMDSKYCMNDQKYCPDHTLDFVRSEHQRDVDWLKTQDLRTGIVVTHHVPSYDLIHPIYRTPRYDASSSYFYSDQSELLSKSRMWIFGHTHMPMLQMVNGCYCVCNPLGYSSEVNSVRQVERFRIPPPRT